MTSKLFTEITIGSMKVKNRTFMAPMSLGYESLDGTINETLKEYWLARAKGGVGCIITDALSVDPHVPYLGNTLCFASEESIAPYRSFTDKVHSYGTKIIPQITHPGPESVSAFMGIPPVASSVYLNSMGQKTRELSLEEIPGIIEKYALACENAKRAGFDGIELHCAHAYMLLGSFLSPMRNKRTDRYGGTLINRARLLFEVVDAIKERCGKDYPIILRISGSERDPQGNTIEDIKYLAPMLSSHGIDAFEVSGGTQYERCNKIIPCHGEIQGINVPEAEALKKVTDVPVLVVGKITDPAYALYLVDSGKVNGVVLGRALLADPDFVNKTQRNEPDTIAPCAACGIGCIGEQTKRRPASCVINPMLGREKEFAPFTEPTCKSASLRRAAVIGGGIGGMAAARAYALKGLQVTLFERAEQPGGQLRLACIPPHKQEISRFIVYLADELHRLGVNMRCGTEATVELLDEQKPDVAVVATGATEMLPPAEGIDPNTAITAWQVLKNEVPILGGNVLIVGGGMVGCELAEFLMHQKIKPLDVTIIEMTDSIGGGMVPNNLLPAMKRMKHLGIRMLTNTKLLAVNGQDAQVECNGEKQALLGFSHIVYACGARPVNALYEQIRERYPKVVCIGDAHRPAQALEAVREAYEAALSTE